MAHEAKVNYSPLVLAKIRAEMKLKNGVVFNNDYEGDAKSGYVKIPVRDEEVAVSDYDRLHGIEVTEGGTGYVDMILNRDKGVNEIIDGHTPDTVPDNIVADRINSAGYALAMQEDNDGGSVLLAGATVMNVAAITVDTVYSTIVDIRQGMSEDNIPDDGRRYLLATPRMYSLILKCPEFVKASDLGDAVVQQGVVGRIAGFNVIEWNDKTANLAFIAGHPNYATRAEIFKEEVHLQDLSGSGKWIGAIAVQGRVLFGHKVLRSIAIKAVYSAGALIGSVAKADKGVKITIAAGATGTTFAYKINPAQRAVFNQATADYAGTSLTSGSTVVPAAAGDVVEVANIDGGKVVAVGYFTV